MASFDESNSVPFTVLEEETSRPRIGLELEVYEAINPQQIIDVVPYRTSPSTLDEMKNPGGGSFTVQRDDPKLLESPTLLNYRNVVKCRLDRKVIGAFLLQNKDLTIVDKDEVVAEQWNLAGEGLRAWFRDAVVLPYGGVKEDSQNFRAFSFASERGSWYKDADWVEPVKVHQYTIDPTPTNPWGTAPAEWPDADDAYWIWGVDNSTADPAPEGTNFFRYEFETTEEGLNDYSVFAAGDDDFDIYVDAAQVITSRETSGYAQTWRADFQLTAGSHVLAARVKNNGGPAALIAALFKAGDAAAEVAAEKIAVTGDAGWVVNAYPDPAPGWTPGEIILTLLAEADARGVKFPSYLTPTFTTEVDSNGASWPRLLDWEFDIGTEYYTVVEMLEEVVCDLWIDPDNLELNMYIERGEHRDTQSAAVQPVTFNIGRNVIEAGSEGVSDIKNTLLIEHTEGYGMEADALTGSITDYGRIEGFISTGASPNVSSDVARSIFTQKAEPSTSTTFEIIDTDDARPHRDFSVGDWVLAPSEDGLVPRRVLSISATEDSKNGKPKFAVEVDTIFEDLSKKYERWLRTASDGTLGGTLANASGSGGGGSSTPSSQTAQRGPQGLQGVAGPRGVVWLGTWNALTEYIAYDVVSHQGSTWIALEASLGSAPSDVSLVWDLFAAKGTDGTDGADGVDGVDGDKGDQGEQGPGVDWRGEWSAGITYAEDDLVSYSGSTYVATYETTGDAPPSSPGFWQLFAQRGATGALTDRSSAVYTTASLITGGSEQGTIPMSVGYRLYRITTDVPSRVRLYGTAAKRAADLSRPVGTDPTDDHGLLFEFVTTASVLSAYLSPLVDGASFEDPPSANIPITVTNLSGTSGTVQVTLVHAITE